MASFVYKKKKKRLSRRAKTRIFFLTILMAIVLLVVYYFKVITPIVVTLSEEKVRSLSTEVISESVREIMTKEDLKYEDLVTIEYNSNNEVTLISTNSVKVNLLIREVTDLVQIEIDALGQKGVDIALGTFTGIPFLYGIGPMITVKLVPVGTVNTLFDSTLTSAGINVTLHRLYVDISVVVGMVLPGYTQNITTMLELEVCESIIAGKVPEFYLQNAIPEN